MKIYASLDLYPQIYYHVLGPNMKFIDEYYNRPLMDDVLDDVFDVVRTGIDEVYLRVRSCITTKWYEK
jgi:hypothetical protein